MTDSIRQALPRKVLAVIVEAENHERLWGNGDLAALYWSIGLLLDQCEPPNGWGDQALNELLDGIQKDLPGLLDLSANGLRQMQGFFRAYPEGMPQVAAKPQRRRKRRSAVHDARKVSGYFVETVGSSTPLEHASI